MRRTKISNAKSNFNKGNKTHKLNRVKPSRGGIRL